MRADRLVALLLLLQTRGRMAALRHVSRREHSGGTIPRDVSFPCLSQSWGVATAEDAALRHCIVI